MKKYQISNEIRSCKARIDLLKKEIEFTECFSERRAKIDEMILLAIRIGELDTMNKQNILKETKLKFNGLIDRFK